MKRLSFIFVFIAYAIIFLHAAVPHVHHGAESHLYSDEVADINHHHNLLVNIFSAVDFSDNHFEEILLQAELDIPAANELELLSILPVPGVQVEPQDSEVHVAFCDPPLLAPTEQFISHTPFRGPPSA